MNILKAIKQFLWNKANKAKLIDSPQDNNKSNTTIKDKNKFNNIIKISSKNLSNSEERTGTKCISNMLILLGANEKLATNHIVLAQIEPAFLENIPVSFAKRIMNGDSLDKKEIKECLKSLQKDSQSHQAGNKKSSKKFRINNDGTILEKGRLGDNKPGEKNFSINENEELIIQENYTENCPNEISRYHQKKYVYNNMNILMKRTDVYTDIQKDGKLSAKLIRDTRKRDEDYPFIIYHNYQDQNENRYEDIYSIAYAYNISSMENEILFIGGEKIESKEQIDSYYQKHKKDILNLLVSYVNDNEADNKGRKANDMYAFATTSKIIGEDCKNAYKRYYGREL